MDEYRIQRLERMIQAMLDNPTDYAAAVAAMASDDADAKARVRSSAEFQAAHQAEESGGPR